MPVASQLTCDIYSQHNCAECGKRLFFNRNAIGDVVGYFHRCEAIAGHPFLAVDLELAPISTQFERARSDLIAAVQSIRRLGVDKKTILETVRRALR